MSKKIKVTMVFLGLRFIAIDGKRAYRWLEVEGPESEVPSYPDDERQWTKQIQKGATPGAVYTFDATRDGRSLSVTVNSGVYLGRLEDEDRVAKLQLAHKGATMAADAQSKAKKELRRRLDLERLEPIRQAYQCAKQVERAHILAAVIHAVTNGRPLK